MVQALWALQEFEMIVSRSEPNRIVVLDNDYITDILDDSDPIFETFPSDIYVDRGGVVKVQVVLADFVTRGNLCRLSLDDRENFHQTSLILGIVQEHVSDVPDITFHLSNGSLMDGRSTVKYSPEKRQVIYTVRNVATHRLFF